MSRKHLTEDQIQRMIASDPEAPEVTADQLAQARPFTEAFPPVRRYVP